MMMVANSMTRARQPVSLLIVSEQAGCLPRLVKGLLDALKIQARVESAVLSSRGLVRPTHTAVPRLLLSARGMHQC